MDLGSRSLSRRTALKTAAGAAAGAVALRYPGLVAAAPRRAVRAQAATPGVLRWAHYDEWAGKEVLDPASPNRFWESLGALYNRLVKPDDAGLPVPDLATEWMSDETAEAWTFKLRSDVTFHDGKPFTSADVLATMAHVLDPALESPGSSVLQIVDLEGSEALDDLTVTFKLKQPHADFPMLMLHYSMYIVPDGADAKTIGETGIGTGPFRIDVFEPGGNTRVVANEDYWEGVPALSAMEFLPIADVEARVNALLAGQADYISELGGTSVPLLQTGSDVVVQELPSGNWTTLVMNCTEAPFDNPEVRQAMKLVMDRPLAVQAVLQGHGVPAYDHPVWPGDPYVLEDIREQDVEQARQLLANAGFVDNLSVELHTSDLEAAMASLPVVYKEMAAEAGIDVEIIQNPADGYWNDVWMQVPFCTSSWGERPADQVLNEVFRAGASWNESFWEDETYGETLDAARRELDFEKRRALYQDAQRMLMNGSGNIIPFFTTDLRAMSGRVKNFPETQRDWNYFTVAVE
jgi:peptide/nickel transport system substrate-binding protein